MNFDIGSSIKILERTPELLQTLLRNIDEDWTHSNEGGDSWSVYDIIGHFIHGEKTDWVPRAKIILSNSPNKAFVPFDRFAQLTESGDKTLTTLLEEFDQLRRENIAWLRSKDLRPEELGQKGIHPAFGEVTLSQLLAAWVVHDLNHIGQIARVMAKQYKEAVGPWTEYLKILQP